MYFVKQSFPVTITPGTTTITNNATATASTFAGGITNIGSLTVGQPIVSAGFPSGTTVTSLISAGFPNGGAAAATATGFTTSAAYTGANPPVTAPSILSDVPNQWQVFTTVQDPTTNAYLYPSPAPTGTLGNGNFWVASGILSFTNSGTFQSYNANDGSGPFNNSQNVNPAGAPTYGPPAANLIQNGVAPAALPATASTFAPVSTSTAIAFTPAGANAENIPFDFNACTQFGTAFGVNSISQDGYTAGQLTGFTIGTNGIISGTYSNSQTQPLGQIALATFPNNQGLQPQGMNEWSSTSASGAPVVNTPGSGNSGVLQTSSTESSNVDLTQELVNMMTTQRSYQANAQTIKTADAVMQTLLNLR